jgi:hypothetical protein
MGLIYGNLYTLYINMKSIMFEFFKNYILIACDNYFKIIVNVPLKYRLCYN